MLNASDDKYGLPHDTKAAQRSERLEKYINANLKSFLPPSNIFLIFPGFTASVTNSLDLDLLKILKVVSFLKRKLKIVNLKQYQ